MRRWTIRLGMVLLGCGRARRFRGDGCDHGASRRSDALAAAARRAHDRDRRRQQRLSYGHRVATRGIGGVRERPWVPALIAVAQRFAAYRVDRVRLGRPGILSVGARPSATCRSRSRCARCSRREIPPCCMSSASATSRCGHSPSAELVRVPLSMTGFDQMLAKLDATFVPPQAGALPDLGRGLYGPSLFYPANGTFSLFRLCNHWIADLLGAAGLPTAPVLATLPSGLMFCLRWRAGLLPVRPHDSKGGSVEHWHGHRLRGRPVRLDCARRGAARLHRTPVSNKRPCAATSTACSPSSR